MLVAALLTGLLSQDCAVCSRVPARRISWGCDEPAAFPFIYITCPRCLGQDMKCKRCEGDPRGVGVTRCPYATIPKHILGLSPWYNDWKNGLLPVAGGVLDQSAFFVDAMRYLDQRVSVIQQAQADST